MRVGHLLENVAQFARIVLLPTFGDELTSFEGWEEVAPSLPNQVIGSKMVCKISA